MSRLLFLVEASCADVPDQVYYVPVFAHDKDEAFTLARSRHELTGRSKLFVLNIESAWGESQVFSI